MVVKKTTIKIHEKTALKLKSFQESLSETYNDLINKIINFYEINRK